MERLLLLWEDQSAKLRTLDVKIYRIDVNPAWKEEIHYEGRAVFKSPELAYLDFKQIKTAPNAQGRLVPAVNPQNGKRVTTPHETIICTGKEVWQYLYDVHQIFIYPLDKNQRKRALDEGPLPFLFNMRAEDAKQRYAMTLQGENKEFYWVVIQPRLQEDRESFKVAWVVLDRKFLLPVQIKLFSPDGKSTKDFRLSDIRPNSEVPDRIFQGGVPTRRPGDPRPPWKVIHNPAAQAPPGGEAAGRQGRPGDQPAPRPMAREVPQGR
jgi:TIGR03009 family protein